MDLQKVERVYTAYANIYDHVFGKVFHEGRESAIRNLNVQPNERILEVGVGTGLALPMYPRHCQIVGIDLSEGMLEKAKERASAHRLSHVRLYRMDAGAMEFPDDSFDTVVAAYVVTAVPDYRSVRQRNDPRLPARWTDRDAESLQHTATSSLPRSSESSPR
ncbi:MAG: hypothetical protein KatS3mg082_1605 [Nitrospiraceae bacterium]|nr:MAG: hypothetical protein KatS3mg082_1605 [Nitrospiraceae bacterium]